MNSPPFISDPNYCRRLFLPYKKQINRQIKSILEVKGERKGGFLNRSFIVRYEVLVEKINGRKIKVAFWGLSSPDPTRLQSFQVMNYLWGKNFSTGEYLIPQPLAYIKKHSLVITREIKGKPLLEILKEGRRQEILNGLKKSAKWLEKLHQTKPYNFKDVFLSFGPLYWREQLRILKGGFPKKIGILKKIIKEVLSWENQNQKNPQAVITHHDFHPKNIFLKKNKIGVLDFSESRLSNPIVDVISFLIQLDFINQERIKRFSQKELKEFCRAFLKEYFGRDWEGILKKPSFRKDFILLRKRIALQSLVGNLLFGKKPKLFTDIVLDKIKAPFVLVDRL